MLRRTRPISGADGWETMVTRRCKAGWSTASKLQLLKVPMSKHDKHMSDSTDVKPVLQGGCKNSAKEHYQQDLWSGEKKAKRRKRRKL